MLITARILLTLAALGFSAITVVADLNKTHAANPLWTPHARFHVVWQVLSYNGIALVMLYLIWTGGPARMQQLYIAARWRLPSMLDSSAPCSAVRFTAAGCSTPTAIRRSGRRSARKTGSGT